MGKRILIGSSIAVVLLLLMPSIPAVQQKTIEDKTYNDLEKKFDDFDLEYLEKIMSNSNRTKHPILLLLVTLIYGPRFFRGIFLMFISIYIGDYNPLLLLRSYWLVITAQLWFGFWYYISQELGWNW